ncbi:MAG: hypothetical protein L6Q57_03295 [Alphaproteobacteria bacterium]|nr:hypothetical protein [Alphaproteobacteria bacterium]
MDHTPPHHMSAAERMAEIAGMLAEAIIRLKNKSKNNDLIEHFAGLHCPAERPCSHENGDCDDK